MSVSIEEVLLRHASRLFEGSVSLDEDLFGRGISSLTLARLAIAVSEDVGHEVPLSSVIGGPSLRAILAAIRSSGLQIDEPGALPPLAPMPRLESSFPVSAGQERQIWRRGNADAPPAGAMAVAWHLLGPLDPELLQTALSRVCAIHEGLHTRFFVDHSGEPRQQVRAIQPARLTIDDADDTDTARELLGHRLTPFDWEGDNLARLHLATVAADEHVLMLVVDSVISDGWSVDLITRQLGETYEALLHGRPPTSVAAAVQPIDHELWLRSWIEAPAAERFVRYWDGVPRVTQLPEAIGEGHGLAESKQLPQRAVMAGLENLTGRLGVSALALHLTLAGRAVAAALDSPVASVFVPLANRPSALQETVGRFMHTTVISVPGPPTALRTACRQVADDLYDAVANQALPGGVMRRNRERSGTAAGCVYFSFDEWDPTLSLSSCSPRPFQLEAGEAGPRHLYLSVLRKGEPQIRVAADQGIVHARLVHAIHDLWQLQLLEAATSPT
jgi:hypothetical protein